MASLSKAEKEIVNSILKESNLTADSILYRYTSEQYLKKNDEGKEVLIANQEPKEMIVDNYKGHGHVYMAKDIGPGLSFLTERLDEYEKADRVCVSVRVIDILEQGGLIYKVTSLPAYIDAFFFTIPGNEVIVSR